MVAKAAERGDADAQHNSANQDLKGEGVQQSFEEAARRFRKAAEHGQAGAQYKLGNMYLVGVGVQKNKAEAVRWMR